MANYFIFRCSNETYSECIEKMLFGQTDSMAISVSKIKISDIIFLHNVQSEILEGPYFAISNGTRNINPDAWNGKFPQQVKVEKKSKISKISNSSFEKFGLRFSKDKKFLYFEISNEVGRKLMEEIGFEIDYVNKEIKGNDTLIDIDIDFRLRYPAKYRCEDGHYVRSISETLIDNWLFSHNIVHGYEKKIPGEFMTCDFYVRDKNNKEAYIEFWGLDKDEVYLKRKKEKVEIYKKLNLNLINISNENIQNLDDLLGDKLKPFLK